MKSLLSVMNNKQRFYVYFFLSVYVYVFIFYFFYSMKHKFHEAKLLEEMKCIYIYNGSKNDELSPFMCPRNNCIFTTDPNIFEANEVNFHAVVFKESILTVPFVPKNRTNSQIYVFHTLMSSLTYPACESFSDNFFNWTYTHRLDSDLIASYILVTNRTGHVVAPSKDVVWSSYTSNMAIDEKIQNILRTKKKAVAWIINVCRPDNKKTLILTQLRKYLSQYSLQVDLYGSCVQTECDYRNCDAMIRQDYYFYMAFEEIFIADYVSEEVMVAYNNYAIPIIFGAANYSWFLPPHSYLDTMVMNPFEIAWSIRAAMMSPEIHQNYFRWTNLYTVTSNSPRNLLCSLCNALNHPKTKYAPVIKDFRNWWNTPVGTMWCNTVYKNKTLMLDDRFRHNRHITKFDSTQTAKTITKIDQFLTQRPKIVKETNQFLAQKSQIDKKTKTLTQIPKIDEDTNKFLTQKSQIDDKTNQSLTQTQKTQTDDKMTLFVTNAPPTRSKINPIVTKHQEVKKTGTVTYAPKTFSQEPEPMDINPNTTFDENIKNYEATDSST